MSITENQNAIVINAAAPIGLAQMFTETASATNPAYLVLTAIDRKVYTAGATGATGTLSGNGHSLGFSNIGGDARGAGIVFTYQASSGRYYSSIYGFLDLLTYNASGSSGDVTNLSLFGTSSLSQATAYASNAYSIMQADASGYLGSATVVTQPKFSGSVPVQATPSSIAAVANGFVGQAWNMNGCWVLASTIAADAGASLPVQSTQIGLAGKANGEWIVAFNGPAGQSGNWQSMVTAGEMIVFQTGSGGGHITTCVSGFGSTAMLVDNIAYSSGTGQITNSAKDGSADDIIVSAAHAASQEWSGVSMSSVVIYELDTPIVTAKVVSQSLTIGSSQLLGSLFSVVDPASKAITQWQIYDTATTDFLVAAGVTYRDHAASSALTVTALSSVSLLAGTTLTTDTLEVRAYNGSYWGDWTALAVSVVGQTASPPVLVTQTAGQTWLGGKTVSLALPTGTFTDPQGQKLTYSATLSSGSALPSWLSFNATTQTFTGTAPTSAQTLGIVVKATDTSGLSVTDSFSAAILGTPVASVATANQTWNAGAAISLVLPSDTFTDPQHQTLTYSATLSNGSALPSWLTFNAKTETFSGTAPATAQTIGITVTATDTSGLSSSETFNGTVKAVAPKAGISVTAPTANQTWVDGTAHTLVLPANTFTDALGLKMTFAAYQLSGPNVSSWLAFNAATDTLAGTVPKTGSGTIQIEVIATDSQHMTATDLFTITFGAATSQTATGALTQTLGAAVQDVPPVFGIVAFHA